MTEGTERLHTERIIRMDEWIPKIAKIVLCAAMFGLPAGFIAYNLSGNRMWVALLVSNRGAVSQTVTISGPLGTQTPTVSAAGWLPGVFFGTIMLVQNGTVAPY